MCMFVNDHVCIAHVHALLFFVVRQMFGQAFGNSWYDHSDVTRSELVLR